LSNAKGKPAQISYSGKKQSFETSIEVDAVHYREFTLTAVGDEEAVLGSWSVGFQGVLKVSRALRVNLVEDLDFANII